MMEKQSIMPYKRQYGGQAKIMLKDKKKFLNMSITKNTVILILLSILLGRANILGNLVPFGVAFFVSLLSKDRKYEYLGLAVFLGILTSGADVAKAKYALALFSIWIVCNYARDKIRYKIFRIAAMGSISMFVSGFIYISTTSFYMYDLFMVAFESIVVFVFTYILYYAVPVLVQKTNRKILSNEELICIAISVAIGISGFMDMEVMELSIKNIMGILLTLIFAYNGGASIGASVGVTIGVITSMSTVGTPTMIGIYGFSGLLSGVFKDLGKIGSALGMILGNALLTFYINGSTEVIIAFKEIILAFAIFMCMPQSVFHYMEKFVNPSAGAMQFEKMHSDKIKNIIYRRLKEYADAFEELAVTYNQIAEKNKVVDQEEIADVVNRVVHKLCKDCGMCRSCWTNNFYKTYTGIVDTITYLEISGRISEDQMPEDLKRRCIKSQRLIEVINNIFEMYTVHYEWQKKLFESRQLVAEQIEDISRIIGNLGKEINLKMKFNTELEDAIYVAFDKEGLKIDQVTVLEKENGKFEIEIEKRSCFDRKQCDDKIAPIVSKVIGREMVRKNYHCMMNQETGSCSFTLTESEKYKTATGVARIAKDKNNVCGDHYSCIDLNNGQYMVALSDGMGSGEKASKESTAAITLLEQLMEAGFDKDIAIKTINSILVLKSSEEIFSTMDLSILDLYNGKVEFAKIGAASSFIKRVNGEVEVIKSTSLPIGILNNVDIECFGKKLNNGDFIIMMSDGVLESDQTIEEKENWVIAALKQLNSKNPQVLAEKILDRAIKKYGNHIEDDMTVLVSKIWKN